MSTASHLGPDGRPVTAGGCPVAFDGDVGMWVVRDPAAVRGVLLDPDTFGPDNALTAYRTMTVRSLRILNRAGFALPPMLANNSGPSHRAVRGCVARFFSAGQVQTITPTIIELTDRHLAETRARLELGDPVDLVEAVAGPVPALTLQRMTGIRMDDIGDLKRWSEASLELFWGTPDPERQELLAGQAAEFYSWLRAQVVQERRAVGTGLLAALIELGLTDEQICSACYFLLIAGQQTTSQLISTCFLRALGDPLIWNRCGDVTVADEIVDAVLAEQSSVHTWRRIVNRPTRIGEQDLAAETELLLRLTGIGGDPDLAFGLGIHRCLGARLARREAGLVLSRTAAQLGHLELLEPEPPMIGLLSFRAPARVLVRAGHVDPKEAA